MSSTLKYSDFIAALDLERRVTECFKIYQEFYDLVTTAAFFYEKLENIFP